MGQWFKHPWIAVPNPPVSRRSSCPHIEPAPLRNESASPQQFPSSTDRLLPSHFCRQYGAPFVSEVRESGPWRTSVTGHREGLLKQTARIPGADCCRSPSERAVGAGRGRPAVTGRRDGLLKQTARIPGADCCRSSSERAVDGRPWRAAGIDFWNKRHGFLAPIVAEVRQSGPWERAVDGRPWRAAGTDFWNKRHGFLSPIVAEVRQSGPWTAGRDGPPERTFETNGTDSWRRLLQKSVRAGRGSRPWTAGRDGPPGIDFWNKRHGFLAPIVSKVCQIGPWGRAVDGWPWRAFISPQTSIRGLIEVCDLPDLDHARETPFQHNLHIKQCLRHYVQEAIFTWMTENDREADTPVLP